MNNDRFKFRYYYITEKRYLKNSEIQAIACMSMIEQKVEDSAKVEQALCAAITGEIITEQCTGLEDENGKLIFEGDKVRMTEFYFDGCGESERNFVGYVMWNKGEFVLSKNPEKPEYENETEIIPHISWGHSFEIVGNIHEVKK